MATSHAVVRSDPPLHEIEFYKNKDLTHLSETNVHYKTNKKEIFTKPIVTQMHTEMQL
jgi:hypothetical protein